MLRKEAVSMIYGWTDEVFRQHERELRARAEKVRRRSRVRHDGEVVSPLRSPRVDR